VGSTPTLATNFIGILHSGSAVGFDPAGYGSIPYVPANLVMGSEQVWSSRASEERQNPVRFRDFPPIYWDIA
jgi:hypothetical protein